MKLALFITTTLFTIITSNFSLAQTGDNPCDYQWGSQQRALSTNSGGVFYYVQTSKCVTGGVCGNPIIGLEHSFPKTASFDIRLEGIDCDGKIVSSGFYATDKSPNITIKDNGNSHSFKRVTKVISVDATYKDGNKAYRFTLSDGVQRAYINGKLTESSNYSENNQVRLETEAIESEKKKKEVRLAEQTRIEAVQQASVAEAKQHQQAQTEANNKAREQQRVAYEANQAHLQNSINDNTRAFQNNSNGQTFSGNASDLASSIAVLANGSSKPHGTANNRKMINKSSKADDAMSKHNVQKAIKLYTESYQLGYGYSAQRIAEIYYRGKEGIEVNKQIAFQWYLNAAEAYSPDIWAQFMLGLYYQNGDGVAKDYDKAIEWYKKVVSNRFRVYQTANEKIAIERATIYIKQLQDWQASH